MRKSLVIYMTFLLLLVTILDGCTDSSLNDKDKFVGTWMRLGDEGWAQNYTFSENGAFFITDYPEDIGRWYINNSLLTTVYLNVTASAYYAFSNNYKTLTLTDVNDSSTKLVLIKLTQ